MFDKGIMLLGRSLCQRLEPVGIMCHAVLIGPLLHTLCHGIGDAPVERSSIVDHIDKFLIHITLQILVHLGACEHILTEIL